MVYHQRTNTFSRVTEKVAELQEEEEEEEEEEEVEESETKQQDHPRW